jgi:N-acetylglucosamine-6-phosphate deacetylase
MIAISAATLFTPLEQIDSPMVLVEGGVIVDIASQTRQEIPAGTRVVDFGDAVLVPGFFDIHIHGGAGHDVMENTADALPPVEKLLAQHGVSSYFPTTVTAPLDATLAALERLADSVEAAKKNGAAGSCADGSSSDRELRARPLGIHLEGPFISHCRRGVHPPEDLLPPTLAAFERFWQAARGHIRLLTIAPELHGAIEVIKEAAKRGVCVSLGHSDAHIDAARAGMAAGARHSTHTFNAMRPLGHRDPGILGEVLTDARLSADIIVDGIHVDPAVVQLFLKAKGPEGAVLITDATAATGMPDGHYRLGSLDVEVKNGMVMNGGSLAGSVLTMDLAVRNVMKFAQWDLQQAVRLATLNPARVTGSDGGWLKPGAPADLVVLSASGEVNRTIVHGAGI